jgi:carboxylesterase type B
MLFSWFKVSTAVGCGGQEAGEKTIECMRSKPFTAILDGMKKAQGSFMPSADGKVVFSDYAKRRDSENFIKVPILVGNTDDEPGMRSALGLPSPKATLKKRQYAKSRDGCGPHTAASARVKAGLPSWRYLSAMLYPNVDIGSSGSWHGADIGFAFGTQEYLSHVVSIS